MLTLPDSSSKFVVEVDASDLGVGAVLSQRSVEDGKPPLCIFLPAKLSSAERHNNMGDRELLAIKVAFKVL